MLKIHFLKKIHFLWFVARQIYPSGTEHFRWLFCVGWKKPEAPFQRLFFPFFPSSTLFPQHYSSFFTQLFSAWDPEFFLPKWVIISWVLCVLDIVLSTLYILFYSMITTILWYRNCYCHHLIIENLRPGKDPRVFMLNPVKSCERGNSNLGWMLTQSCSFVWKRTMQGAWPTA